LILLVTAHWWVSWILPGFTGERYQLTLNLVRIQVVTMIFSALLSVLWAIHSAKGKFLTIEITSIAANIIAFIVLIFLLDRLGIYMAAWVSMLKVVLQVVFLSRVLGPYKQPNFRSVSFKVAGKKLKPLVMGNAYYQTDSLADRYLTSTGLPGELTLLNFAQQLYQAANSIFVKVLVNTMIPEMAKAHANGDIIRYNRILKKRLLISFVCISIGFIFMLLIGEWLLEILFAFKKMTQGDVHQLWWLLVLLGGYLFGDMIGHVGSAAFYAKGDTTTPTKIGMVLFTLYMPVKIYCYYKFGITGLAIAVSTYQVISFSTKLVFLRKHLFGFK
ncbi:MAG: lipid II flippase MurJ, partial [Ferruginibacter sp.]